MKSAFLLILLTGLSLTPHRTFATCHTGPTDELTIKATSLLLEKDVQQQKTALRTLKEAAAQGNNASRLCLAWLHLNKLLPRSNNDEARQYLVRVGVPYETTSHILLGAVYAEGSVSTLPNVKKAKYHFAEAKRRLDLLMEDFQQGPPQSKEDVEKALAWESDYTLLYGLTKKYGVPL